MIEKDVSKLVECFLKTNPKLSLPKRDRIERVEERIYFICQSFQDDAISRILSLPKKQNPEKVRKWIMEHKRFMKKGIGIEKLIKNLPDFKNPEKISEIIDVIYGSNPIKGPIEAGNYAQKYISFTPFVNFHKSFKRKISEPGEHVKIPQTGDIIHYQYDLLSTEAIYEFKLTTSKNIEKTLRKALIQLYLYDFLYRMKSSKRQFKTLLIEIYLVDKREIWRYGKLFENDISVDKDVLKQIFKVNEFSNLDVLNRIIDDIYDSIEPCLQEDVDRELKYLKKRDE
ncbi:MAG: hypothetical protein ABIF85_00065 [Nanoarchaeota archaeon]|nr:hypothetical protein [Nanoarchaeota archaeon]MBU4300041.1 hypothetical protein [Nanoarchaeota archaeon]MBU4451842.1 hypothetical protein [Nanoarchaeota archaeon]MCG2724422.1 hypothetical protein [archaeon]